MIDGVDAEKLGAAQALAASKLNFGSMANPQEVSSAGVYLIKATDTAEKNIPIILWLHMLDLEQ